MLELFAPPPSTGSSGAYSRTRPYLESARYADDSVVGDWPGRATEAATRATLHVIDPARHHRMAGDTLIGLLWSTAQLTVANVSLSPGGVSSIQRRGGDEVLFGLEGVIHVRAWFADETYVFELRPDEACYLPTGSTHEYRNYAGSNTTAIIGVAPTYLPENVS